MHPHPNPSTETAPPQGPHSASAAHPLPRPELPNEFIVAIDEIAFGGDGLGRHLGCVVFVPFTLPGEQVRVRVTQRHRDFVRAAVAEILEPSPHRVQPRCPLFGQCGGCQLQHIAYKRQLAIKQAQVASAFDHIAALPNPPVEPIIPCPEPYGYRNRITVHAAPGAVGFHAAGRPGLVDVAHCPIASRDVNAALRDLRRHHPASGHFSLREPGIPPAGFHQTNRRLFDTLAETAAAALPASGLHLFEGYCGAGALSARLAGRFARITGCDTDPRLIAAAPALPNAAWHCAPTHEILPTLNPDAILLDPPREGLDPATLAAVRASPAAALVYVSCNPATLARDTARLAGAFTLLRAIPLDLFPQTAQIECVASFIAATPKISGPGPSTETQTTADERVMT